MNYPERVAELSVERPDKPALIWPGGTLSYWQLNNQVNKLGHGLQELGLVKGDRVAVQLFNTPEFVVTFLAVMKIGAVIVPVNPLYKARELELILSDCYPKAMVTASTFAESVLSLREGLKVFPQLIMVDQSAGTEFVSYQDLIESSRDGEIQIQLSGEDLAEMIYTSGTTGRPKGAMLTHNNLYSNAVATSNSLDITSNERTLIIAPLFHIGAQTNCLCTTMIRGGSNYIFQRWESTEITCEAIEDYQITYFFGPPTVITWMVNHPAIKVYNLRSLRLVITGSASLPMEIFKKFREVFGFEIVEGYGLSETSSVVTFNPLYGIKKPGSIGLPIEDVDARVFNNADEELPTGQVGEIVVKGPNVFKGYWNNPTATADALKNGWLRTGDLAYKDKDGYLFIVDRAKDLIIRGGLNIYPREVEEVLYSHGAVIEAAVIGVPDEVMGEQVKAFIVLKEGFDSNAEEIREFCKTQLVHYKVPKFFEFVPSLPKNATGKVIKTELRKKHQEII